MAKSPDMNEILDKIEEMRGFFKIGDEVIPFLSDLFIFLRDVMPLMSEMNLSIKDSTGKLPNASSNIASVSEATELATNEILNKLDSISAKLEDLSNLVADKKKGGEIVEEINNELNDIIYSLQFQDITSQQLDHTNRILKAISEKFVKLFKSMEKLKSETEVGKRVVDMMETSPDEEKRAEDVEQFEEKTSDNIHSEGISQDDINALFNT